MCRLFGMSGGMHEVQATFWLLDAPTSLITQSESQPDGVGLGTFETDGTPSIYRKPVAANRSQTFIASAHAVRSRTFLSHIRHATAGEPTLENTHPFEQQGRIFAHNGVLGDLPGLRRRLGSYAGLVCGSTDSELFFTLVTKCIDERSGDIGAGIAAAANEIAAEIPLYSLNMVLTTPTDVWALRYPDTNELWILEGSIGGFVEGSIDGFDPGSFADRSASGIMRSIEGSIGGLDSGGASADRSASAIMRSVSGIMRVQSAELSIRPATVIASERMDTSTGWRLLQSGELVHVDRDLHVTSTIAVPGPPAQMIDLNAEQAVAQGEGSTG
jgi:predicted glutamine amidotransferase